MAEYMPRTSHKTKAEKLEIRLVHATRRAEWAEREAKAAKFDLGEARAKIARLERELAAARESNQLTFDGVA